MSVPGRALRRGCLGCVGRLLAILALGVVVGSALVIGIDWLFTPWAFYLGGRFHVFPLWAGSARAHTASGDYTLYVWMSPTSSGRLHNYPTFKGQAYLCTPHGDRFTLRLSAYMFDNARTDTNGMEILLEMYQRRWFWSWSGDGRPRLRLRGKWQNPDLVTNDGGSFSVAFLPDGRLYEGPAGKQPRARETVPVVFHEVPWVYSPRCGTPDR